MMMWLDGELNCCSFDLARDHEVVPKAVQDAPEDEVHSDDESDDEDRDHRADEVP